MTEVAYQNEIFDTLLLSKCAGGSAEPNLNIIQNDHLYNLPGRLLSATEGSPA